MSERRPLRVLLADDHVTVRHGLKLLIEGERDMTVVGEASDGAAAVKLALECRPDVVVMDVSMPGVNGLVATRMLKKSLPGRCRRDADAARRRCVSAGAAARRRVRLRAEAEPADRVAAGDPGDGDRHLESTSIPA